MNQQKKMYQRLQKIAKGIGKKFKPSKIILFGSLVHGGFHEQSDADLLVIFPGKTDVSGKYPAISKEFEPRPFPIDLLIRSSQEIQRRIRIGDGFIKEIMSKGVVLYES